MPCDFHCYRDRNCIERMFNRMKQLRRTATCYDKEILPRFSLPRRHKALVTAFCEQNLDSLATCGWKDSGKILCVRYLRVASRRRKYQNLR
ncbi:hypothetical protein C3920_09770 [Novacetimonas pomaceti]|uniref:Transposase DDE domain-containing protein n=1 Tax=Novacetimonas pomaceti TaxID=2021998 RepID=A0ABX5P154_9PROT|nr:hypothetical protein C3920_09770 [Novacetimonas pomaceti]